MIDLKPYYQVKLTHFRCMSYYTNNPPKTEEDKYIYDIIQQAYWINEKKIETLDYRMRNKLIEDYYKKFKKS